MLAGLLLDAAIRTSSRGERSLDDAARQLLSLATARRNHNVSVEELRAAVAAAGGPDAERTWARIVEGTAPLTERDVADALAAVTGQVFAAPPANAKIGKQLAR